MTHIFSRKIAGLLLGLCLATPAALQAPAALAADDVSLNFVNADMESVIRAISKITNRNFLIDPRVKGTLNIVTSRPVSPTTAYQILLSALRMQGFAAVEEAGIVKVLPEGDAKQHSVPVRTGSAPAPRGDQLVTRVFTLKNESAAQLLPVIRPLVAPNNPITSYAANNSLVVTDYAENVARIAQLIDTLDVPQGNVVVIQLKYASALDLAGTVGRALGDSASAEPSQRVTVVADPRVNSLLLRSDNAARLAAARQLIASLDQPGVSGNIRVIYLKNSDAVRMAQTLREILSGEAGSSSTPAQRTALTQPGGTQNPAAQAATAVTANPAATGGGGGSGIVADRLTNSLIVTASDEVYNNIRRVVEQLDRRRAQVFIEALIAEMTSDRAAEFGIQWQSANTPTTGSGTTAFGGTNFGAGGRNIIGLAVNPASVAPGLNLIAGGGTITLPGSTTPILNLSVLARFLETQTNTNILSTPNITVLDNEEAKIVVGQNLPFLTGQYSNTGGGTTPVNPFQTIERRDVGLTLRIKPQISEGGTVLLQITQESSSVDPTSFSNATGPVTNKRSIDTVSVADDGAIIALGGLVQDSYGSGTDKVPVLGDIPILGSLFRYDTRKRTKTNLYIFLRPKIMRDGEGAQNIVGSSRVDLQACKLEYSIVSPK